MPETLSVAVCISDGVTLSDFVPPMEILAAINQADHPLFGAELRACMPEGEDVPVRISIDYVAPENKPVVAFQGLISPTINPTMTYAEAMEKGKQFDILWCPAGPLPDLVTGAHNFPEDELAFIKQQAPKARYLMSVCTGAHQLALAGVLSGKRATTNKKFFKVIGNFSPKDIEWVAHARWVVDGNVWTSSGVSAGQDMALAFVEHLTNAAVARVMRGVVEVHEATQQDDPFAAFHGLV
ncbi:DJ-1 protein-PfpI domain-containing protein [Mycena indigotica]|uniref:DJ-1 protein-PfpI domain-containing protein n=1 Tax=Mycena indigotica TaxID=2126181 RepID=A0A8H6SE14_9AGAR|nr:DJ-1 protein-PfpI domain-containing protein [Mycena indigotica]KAF7297232.1 DJ-1 protein-PfpI domain-containing protein [Mycena indigotica]